MQNAWLTWWHTNLLYHEKEEYRWSPDLFTHEYHTSDLNVGQALRIQVLDFHLQEPTLDWQEWPARNHDKLWMPLPTLMCGVQLSISNLDEHNIWHDDINTTWLPREISECQDLLKFEIWAPHFLLSSLTYTACLLFFFLWCYCM